MVKFFILHMQIIGFSKASAELSRILLGDAVCVRVCVFAVVDLYVVKQARIQTLYFVELTELPFIFHSQRCYCYYYHYY